MESASSSDPFPPYPPMGSLRLAVPADIPRLAEISMLGYFDSEIFRYTRPYTTSYPQDTWASYADLYHSQLLDPRAIVIVVEDEWSPHENLSSLISTYRRPRHKEMVVVGVAHWILPKYSRREGQFILPGGPERAPSLGRDLYPGRLKILNDAISKVSWIYIDRHLALHNLVVHPLYRRRGHATSMVEWSMQLCNRDVTMGMALLSPHASLQFFVNRGLKIDRFGWVKIPKDGDAEGFNLEVVEYGAGSCRAFELRP